MAGRTVASHGLVVDLLLWPCCRYFLRKLRKVKKANGQILAINEVRGGRRAGHACVHGWQLAAALALLTHQRWAVDTQPHSFGRAKQIACRTAISAAYYSDCAGVCTVTELCSCARQSPDRQQGIF
jgi:hypothetical protein